MHFIIMDVGYYKKDICYRQHEDIQHKVLLFCINEGL